MYGFKSEAEKEEFIEYTKTSIVRTVYSKAVIGEKELNLKEYPKISHTAESFFGEFPTKTCELTVFDFEDNVDLNEKEITVYRGIEVNGRIVWVDMGLFSATPENITSNKTSRSISFKGSDRSVKFDTPHTESGISYPISLGNYLKCICNNVGVELFSSAFPLSDYILIEAPNIKDGASEREVVARIAELGGAIAQITRDGKLKISAPEDTGIVMKRHRFQSLSLENAYGPVDSVILSRSPQQDEVVYPAAEGSFPAKLDNNPFADLVRAGIIESVFNELSGRIIIPFSCEGAIEDFITDINDVVSIEKKDGSFFKATVLSVSTKGRIKADIKAEPVTEVKKASAIAGSTKEAVKNLELTVDYNKQQISAVVSRVETLENGIGEVEKSVTELTTATEKAITVGERYFDGVKEVNTGTGFVFDKDGLHVNKTGAETEGTFNEAGLKVTEASSGDTLLFAGYDGEKGESVVETKNLSVEKYFSIGKNARFEDYADDRTGCFYIGGEN